MSVATLSPKRESFAHHYSARSQRDRGGEGGGIFRAPGRPDWLRAAATSRRGGAGAGAGCGEAGSDRDRRAVDCGTVAVITSHGHRLAVPRYIPELVQHLTTQAEAWWCTTWWHRANGVIRAHLGIDPLPVIDDDRRSVGLEWKVRTAAPLITEAASNGRHASGSRTSTAHFPSSTGRLPLSTLLLRVSLDGPTDRTREDLTPVCRRPPPRGPR